MIEAPAISAGVLRFSGGDIEQISQQQPPVAHRDGAALALGGVAGLALHRREGLDPTAKRLPPPPTPNTLGDIIVNARLAPELMPMVPSASHSEVLRPTGLASRVTAARPTKAGISRPAPAPAVSSHQPEPAEKPPLARGGLSRFGRFLHTM